MTPNQSAALEALYEIQKAASGFSSPAYAVWLPYIETIRQALTKIQPEQVEGLRVRITGPDEDRLMWVHFTGTRYQGALSASIDRFTGKAMLEVKDATYSDGGGK